MGASDSKIRYRDRFVRAGQRAVADSEAEAWKELWRLPASVEDVFAAIQPEHMRAVQRAQPANLRVLLEQAAAQLREQADAPAPERCAQVLNCARTLTRALPLLYQDGTEDGTGTAALCSLCWAGAREHEQGVGVVRSIAHAVMRLLVLPGFTVPELGAAQARAQARPGSQDGTDASSARVLWCGGIGAESVAAHRTTSFDRTRIELLRLLLALFSETLFWERAPGGASHPPRGGFVACCTAADCPNAAQVFYSLLNTVLLYDPVGWGVPYASVLSQDTTRERLVDASLHVLLLLLDDCPGGAAAAESSDSSEDGDDCEDDDEKRAGSRPVLSGCAGQGAGAAGAAARPAAADEDVAGAPAAVPLPGANVYRQLLASIDGTAELDLLILAMSRLLNGIPEADSALLPGSRRSTQCHHELLMLFWKLLECNRAFLEHLLGRHDAMAIVFPVLYLMCCNRREPSQAGLMHVCTFILLKMSGQRSFGVALNKPLSARLPGDLPAFRGSHADLLIIVLELVISDGFSQLGSLSCSFLTIISNVSPYCRSLCFLASTKLCAMLERSAKAQSLHASEENRQQLALLLGTLNNIVQYQFEGNGALVYAILANKDVLQQIASLPSPTPGLPLETVMRLVDVLMPQAIDYCAQRGVAFVKEAIVAFLRETTMVGLLPVPHPIVVRTYQPNEHTDLWFTTFIWGTVFLRSQLSDDEVPLFDSGKIRLFGVNHFEQVRGPEAV